MSSRSSFIAVTAIDNIGIKHLIFNMEQYAGGHYSETVRYQDIEHAISAAGDGEYIEDGERLPILTINDLQSYFSPAPTEALLFALNKKGLNDVNIDEFRYVYFDYAGQHIYSGAEIIVTEDGIREKAYPTSTPQDADKNT